MKEPIVVFEDNHLIAVNKPAGWLVQGDETGDLTLADWVKHYIKLRYNKPGEVFLGVVHRLDRPVSGVVLFARTSKALTRLNALFAERRVQKNYLAIVRHLPDPVEARLEHLLHKDEHLNVTKAYDKLSRRAPRSAKLGLLDYALVGSVHDKHLLRVQPLTGRPHQIRAQLAAAGWPIYNDLKYGGTKLGGDSGRIYLHSLSLAFEHPVGKSQVFIKADLPDEQIWRLFHGVSVLAD